MTYEPWMLAAIDQAGYNGIRDEHISAVANELLKTGKSHISRADFDRACSRCGINPNNFTQSDLDALETYMNR